ncbi:MAG TPA: serine/threonine-protein kinase [Planctomycetota bacterium]|nr:serine/threonine-protein kinase [Planctomycetota bacterium]
MKPERPISDATLDHLRAVAERPDVSGTRYELVEVIGRGGTASVWRALDRLLERDVALKVLDEPDEALARELGARLVQEAKVLARLEHPGIVPVHDAGVLADGRVFTCMKWVRGERLDEVLARNPPESERLAIFSRLAESVAFAHASGVLHLDLKPSNVMVGPFGEVLVLDWGLAQLQRGVASSVRLRAGTEGFMSPEQQRGEANVDARSDVFALGRLLAELECGGRELAAIATKAAAEDPADRYASVLELLADVQRFQAGSPVSALPDDAWTKLARFSRKYRAAIWLVAAYAVMRVGFELFRFWLENKNS